MRELLFLLFAYPFDPTTRETLSRLIKEVVDWQSFLKLINDHGIIALAAYNIREAGLSDQIPADAMAYLNRGFMQNVIRNTWLTERWKEVNAMLSDAGISHILLKGMALDHTIYGSGGLRQMNDNDILINEKESLKAWNILKNNGFESEPVKSPLFSKINNAIFLHLPPLSKNGYVIEIHNKLFSNDMHEKKLYADPFAHAVEIEISGQKALILDNEFNFSYLVKHFEGHKSAGDCQLRLYADIKLLDSSISLNFPDNFIFEPLQSQKALYRKEAFRANLRLLPKSQRMLYLIGDTFPTIEWMKKRYKCEGLKLLMHYPVRMAKLFWLI
jgi:hypothetical protein